MNSRERAVIVPIYNEEKAIASVFEKWHAKLYELQIDFEIHTYNDGSTDGTAVIIDEIAARYSRIIVHQKNNSGHGPTILQGYRENSEAKWLFQIDSDDEMEVAAFDKLWLRCFDNVIISGYAALRKLEFFRRPYPIINEQVAISRFKNSNCSRLRHGRFGRVFASGLRYNLSYSDIIVPGCHSGLK